MEGRADGKFKAFSLGMKQRIGIASTLLTNPALVILDEPTNGLDPAGQREIRSIIPRLADEGHGVLLASHMLHEVEQLSDQVVIIRQGNKLTEGSVDELLRGEGFYEIQLEGHDLEAAVTVLRGVDGVDSVSVIEDRIMVKTRQELGGSLNRALLEANLHASQIARKRTTLEDLFLELTAEPAEASESYQPRLIRISRPARSFGAMIDVLQSELFRLRKRAQTWIMPVLASVFILLYYGIGYTQYRSGNEADRLDMRQSVQQLSSIFENGMQVWRIVALIMIVVVASGLIGSEYGWNTLRPLVARSASRTDLLSAKWIVVGLYSICMVVVGVLVSLAASVIVAAMMGGDISLPVIVWDDMLLGTLRWVIATLPYAAIAFAAALLTRSNAAGIAIGIGLNFAELLLFGILSNVSSRFNTIMEYGINWNVQQVVNITTDDGGTMMDPVSTGQLWKSITILTVYCVVAIVGSYLVFTRRDITSG
jgi:ABC-2 type transport system ATP-binding protein